MTDFTRIKLRRDAAADWTSANPTLLQGEFGIEDDTQYLKFGDGSTTWTSLSYITNFPDLTSPTLQTDTITEKTTNSGVTIESLLLKDGNITVGDGNTIGQAAGPLLTFNDTGNFLDITGCDISMQAAKKFYLDGGSDTYISEVSSNVINFVTGTSERVRIDDAGKFGLGITPTVFFHVSSDQTGALLGRLTNSSATNPFGIGINYSAAAPNDAGHPFIEGSDSGGSTQFNIWSDGSFVQTSDEHLKNIIGPTGSQLDNVLSLEIIDYTRIGDQSGKIHTGVSAQKTRVIFPHLVTTAVANWALDSNEKIIIPTILEDGTKVFLDDNNDEVSEYECEQLMLYKIGLIFPHIKAFQEYVAETNNKISNLEDQISTLTT
jgi:hypothetical protein